MFALSWRVAGVSASYTGVATGTGMATGTAGGVATGAGCICTLFAGALENRPEVHVLTRTTRVRVGS